MSNAAFLKRWSWLGMLLLAVGGCQTGGGSELKPELASIPEMITRDKRQELVPILRRFSRYFASEVSDSAARIERKSTQRDVRRATLIWRLKLIPGMEDLLASDDPFAILLDAWALCVRMSQYLQEGEGKDLFGEQQKLAVETAQRLQTRIEEIARNYVAENNWDKLSKQIEAYAKQNPIHGVFAFEAPVPFSKAEPGRSVAELVLGAPLRAAQKVGEGLDPTLRLSQSVDRFRDLMEEYPALLRWQMQLTLLELDDIPEIQTLLRGIENVSQSSVRLTRVAEELPERLRKESEQLLDDFDARQPELRTTLDKLQQTAEGLQGALDQATRAGQAWEQTADAATQTIRQVQQFRQQDSQSAPAGTTSAPASRGAPTTNVSAETGPPFDINDYTRSAEAMTAAASELRSLLSEVRDFVKGETTEQSLKRINALTDTTLGQTAGQAREVIDHAAWRGAELVALIFVLLVGYRLWTRHTPRGSAT